MTTATANLRTIFASCLIAAFTISLTACSSKSSASKLDGIYHSPNGGPMTLVLKDGKATMTIANETQTLDYKIQGNKLTILNPKDGDATFTINDDGTLNSELGVLKKSGT